MTSMMTPAPRNEGDAGGAGHEDLEEARPQARGVAGHPADQVTGAAFVVLLDLQAQEVPAELPPGVVTIDSPTFCR